MSSLRKQKNRNSKQRKFNRMFLSSVMFAFALAVIIPVVTQALVLNKSELYWMLGEGTTYGRHLTTYRTFADGTYAYCLEATKHSPDDGTDLGSNGIYADDNVWKTIKYGYPHRTWYDNSTDVGKKANYYVTQMVVWSFTEGFSDSHWRSMIGNPKYSGQIDTQELINNVINFKHEIENMSESSEPSISVDKPRTDASGGPGEDAVTPWITAQANNVQGNIRINLVNAPSGVKIENEAGQQISEVAVGGKFRFKIPNEHASGTFKYRLSADGESLRAVSYEGGSGYQDLVSYQPVRVQVNAKEEGTVNYANSPKEGWAQIRKVDSITKQPVEGVTFELRQNGAVKYTGTTDASGILKVKVKAGTYEVYETKAPPAYVLAKDPMSVTIRNQGETVDLEFPNKPVMAKFQVLKLDSETKKPLVGAVFGLFQNGNEVARQTTNDKGFAVFNDVRYGTYEIREITAPNGYVLNTQPINVEVNAQSNGQIIALEMPNKMIEGKVEVHKKDSEIKDLVIQGAKFGLYRDDKLMYEATTGADGIARFEKVKFGPYKLKEISPAEGYLHTEKEWDVNITEDGKTYTYNVENDIIKGKIQIVKVDSKNEEKPVKGAVFEVYKASDLKKPIAKLTTDENGFAFTEDLRYGDYVIKEVDAPGEYYINDKLYPVSIREHGKVEVKYIVNNPVEFRLKILKVDGETKKPLEGAHFQIHQNGKPVEFTYQAGNKVVKETTFVTDAEGVILLPKELRAGKYQLVEVKAPVGYNPLEKPIDFEITRDTEFGEDELGKIFEITVKNDIIKGNVKLLKVDNKTKEPLEGVKFELYKTKNIPKDTAGESQPETETDKVEKEDETLVDKAAKFVKSLLPTKKADPSKTSVSMEDTTMSDTPVVRTGADDKDETVPPTEENKDENKDETVPPTGENTEESDKDETVPPTEETKLTPSENLMEGDGKTLENGDTQVGLYATDKDGQIYLEDLKFGDYYFKEVETKEGYVLADEPVRFQVTEHGKTIELTKENRKIEGPVEITKTDVSTGEVLPDTGIRIYGEDGETVITEGRTDDTGKFTFTLEYGKYFFQEYDAPEGYVIDDTKFPFEIKEDGEIVKCQMTNKKIQGTLEITKVDVSDGKLLPDTTFAIYGEDGKEVIVKGKTDENGIAKFKLDYGKYYYQEIEAPAGYMIDQTKFPFEIKEDGEIIKCRMTNTKLPKTGAIDPNLVVGGVAALGGLGTLGVATLRRKRK